MARRDSDLAILIAVALATVAISVAAPPHWELLRLALVVPLVAVCPGLAMLAALGADHMDALARALLVLVVSLAWTLLAGVMLHLTPFGLGGPSFAVTLGAVVIAWTAIAIRRRREAPVAPTAAPAETRPVWALGPPVAARLVLAVAAGLTLAAVGLSVWGARHAGQATFTQLWAMPTADEHSIRIGVENFEGRTMTYALELRAEDEVVRVWPSLLVLPEQPWEDTVPVPVTARSVDVVLVRSDLPAEVYRAVRIWPQGSASSTPRL